MIRWGILGCGDVCERKSGPAFQRVPRSALVAVMRRDGDKARDFAACHGVARAYDDADALLADPEVDAVYVATPPSTHKHYTLLAAAAGKPVYVEKPMATTVAEAEAMRAAFAAADVPLFVAYYRRALPRFLAVRDALPEIGPVRLARVSLGRTVRPEERSPETVSWRVRPEIAGGGHFVDLACHTLDLLDFLLGPLEDVQGRADNQAGLYAAEDAVVATFRCGATLGAGAWSFAAHGRWDEVSLIGARGQIDFATFDDVPVRVTTEGGTRTLAIAHPAHIQEPLIASIVAQLHGEGACASTGDTAIRTTQVMASILARHP